MSALASLNLYKLGDDLENRLLAKAEKRGTKPRALFQAGGWQQRAIAELEEARRFERRGDAEFARHYVRQALLCLAIANRRARGSYA